MRDQNLRRLHQLLQMQEPKRGVHNYGASCERVEWGEMQELREVGTKVVLGAIFELLCKLPMVFEAAKLKSELIIISTTLS